MNKDNIVKLIDGDIFYHYKYCDFLYKNLQEKDKEIERLNNIINELEKYMIKEQTRIVINNTDEDEFVYTDLLIKLKELKESKYES